MENRLEETSDEGGTFLPESGQINKEPVTPTGSPVPRVPTPTTQSCPVCLGPIDNVSFTDTCAHEFCFACLVQWSRVKPECPLCKRRFQVIMYNVKSAIDFSQLPVTEIEPERPEASLDLADLRLFRYPTTMDHRPLSDFIHRNQNREFAAIRRRLQQMIDEMRQRSLEHMRLRLYRNRLKSVVPSNGRIREATPNYFRRYPASTHRLLPFLNRELRVLFDSDNREITRMISLINSLLPIHSITSEEFINAVRPFLGSRAKRFCQELMTFARCPYDLAGYDRNAIYEADSPPIDVDAEPEPPDISALIGSPEFNPNVGVRTSFADFIMSSSAAGGPSTSSRNNAPLPSSFPSDTIEISSDSSSDVSENNTNSWIEVPAVQRVSSVVEVSTPCSMPPSQVEAPNCPVIDDIDDSDDSDCEIVGFDKPWEQRTPVNLTSESEQDIDVGDPNNNDGQTSLQREIDLRKRRHSSSHSSASSSSSSSDEYPSPTVLAARGKRWSPGSLLAATSKSSSRLSFFPPLSTTSDTHKSEPSNENSGIEASSSISSDNAKNEENGNERRSIKRHSPRKNLRR